MVIKYKTENKSATQLLDAVFKYWQPNTRRRIFKRFKTALMRLTEHKFAKSYDSNNQPFKPLATNTILNKIREKKEHLPILVHSGEFRNSFKAEYDQDSFVFGFGKEVKGANKPLIWLHEKGTKYMPSRLLISATKSKTTKQMGSSYVDSFKRIMDDEFDKLKRGS